MRKRDKTMPKQTTYQLRGLTCANCAQKFEKNIRHIDSVKDVRVNFGASQLSVTGDVTIDELERAGAFENIKVFPDRSTVLPKEPFWKKRENLAAFIALFILLSGFIGQFFLGKD